MTATLTVPAVLAVLASLAVSGALLAALMLALGVLARRTEAAGARAAEAAEWRQACLDAALYRALASVDDWHADALAAMGLPRPPGAAARRLAARALHPCGPARGRRAPDRVVIPFTPRRGSHDRGTPDRSRRAGPGGPPGAA